MTTSGRGSASPILVIRALADLRRARTPGTIALYVAIAAAMVLLVMVPFCRPVQDQLARAHHARPSSAAAWTALQLVPKMYSFGHRIWFSREPLTEFLLSRPDGPGVEHETMWVNHYPIRAARFASMRADIVGRGEEVHVFVRTDYRGHHWVSRYVVRVTDRELVLEAIEDARDEVSR